MQNALHPREYFRKTQQRIFELVKLFVEDEADYVFCRRLLTCGQHQRLVEFKRVLGGIFG